MSHRHHSLLLGVVEPSLYRRILQINAVLKLSYRTVVRRGTRRLSHSRLECNAGLLFEGLRYSVYPFERCEVSMQAVKHAV